MSAILRNIPTEYNIGKSQGHFIVNSSLKPILESLVSANGNKQGKMNSLTSRRNNAIHQIGNTLCADEQELFLSGYAFKAARGDFGLEKQFIL